MGKVITRGVEGLRILEALQDGPKLISDVIEATKLPYRETLAILRELERKGFVERSLAGFYYLKGGPRE